MKRAVAHAVLYACTFGCSIGTSSGADLNSSWRTVGQAKVQKKIRTTVAFRPELSLAENNQLLAAHRSRSTIVSTTVPVNQLSNIKLVNHAAQWQLGNHNYQGRITAVTLSADQTQVTIFAEISDPGIQSSLLQGHEAGLLRVEG